MKALTLTQPYATLVALGVKTQETRSWKTPYRGQIAIHVAKSFPKKYQEKAGEHPFCYELSGRSITLDALKKVRGSVIAIATLTDCLQVDEAGTSLQDGRISRFIADSQRPWGDFSPGRWIWFLEDIRPLDEPVPAKEMLGLWDWSPASYRLARQA